MSEFGKDHALIHEMVVTGREVGAGKEFYAALAHSKELFAKVVAFVAEALRLIFTLAPAIERDMTGWKLVEPEIKSAEDGEFELVLQEFLQDGESYLGGEEMVQRGRKLGANSGLKHIEAIIRNQDKIPVEMRQFCLVSIEVWLDPLVYRYVWYAYWHGGRWVLRCRWLSDSFLSSYRLVVPRKYQK